MGYQIFFYGFSGLAILAALAVILAGNPIYAVLSLVAALFALSGLFVLLHAYFVAVIQILVYAGAILVLFLFVVMLLDIEPEKIFRVRHSTFRILGAGAGLFFLWEFQKVLKNLILPVLQSRTTPAEGTTAAIGKLLFTTYALPFEVASLLLFVGIIGAVVLAKKKL